MTEQTKIQLTKVYCDNCGYQWSPRVADPVKCPKCQARGKILVAKQGGDKPRKEKP